MKNLRIVNKAKFITSTFIVLMLLVFAFTSKAAKAEKEIHTEPYTVQAGDVLWNICKPYKPDNMDLREYIFNVCEYNGITADIHIGQEIELIKY